MTKHHREVTFALNIKCLIFVQKPKCLTDGREHIWWNDRLTDLFKWIWLNVQLNQLLDVQLQTYRAFLRRLNAQKWDSLPCLHLAMDDIWKNVVVLTHGFHLEKDMCTSNKGYYYLLYKICLIDWRSEIKY